MLLLLNKAKRTKSKNYIKYIFNITKMENIKVERKISIKLQVDTMNAPRKQLLPMTLS